MPPQSKSLDGRRASTQIEQQVEQQLRRVTDTWLKDFTPTIRRQLAGNQGRFRPRTPKGTILPCELSGVKDDIAAIARWLSLYGYPHEKSYISYRKECLRLIRWSWFIKRTAISSLDRDDLQEFMAFLANPPADWLGARYRLFTPEGNLNPAWRPFERPLRPSSIELSYRVINSLLWRLTAMGYLVGAPALRTRDLEGTTAGSTVTQCDGGPYLSQNKRVNVFTQAEMRAIRDTAAEGPPSWSWMIALFRYAGLSCEEASRHHMHDIHSSSSGQLSLRIWPHIGRPREISFDAALKEALFIYGQAINVSLTTFSQDNPSPAMELPLILGPRGAYSTRHLETMLKRIFTQASQRLGQDDPESAEHLLHATPKWFRNTYIKQLLSESNNIDTIAEKTGLSTYSLSRYIEAFTDPAGLSEPAHERMRQLFSQKDIH